MLLESKTVLKFPGKLTVSAGIGESRKWLIGGKVAYKNLQDKRILTITLIM
jgi:hypothetical protein